MKRRLTALALAVAAVVGGSVWYVQIKLPVRQGRACLAIF